MSDTTNWTCPACGQPRSSRHDCPAEDIARDAVSGYVAGTRNSRGVEDSPPRTGPRLVETLRSPAPAAISADEVRERLHAASDAARDLRLRDAAAVSPPAAPADRDRATARGIAGMCAWVSSGLSRDDCDAGVRSCGPCETRDRIAAALTAARAEERHNAYLWICDNVGKAEQFEGDEP